MNQPQSTPNAGEELPRAKVTRDWKTYLFWIVPLGAALLAGYFIYTNMHKGPKLHIYFSDATQLEAGKSQVRYRGAVIGQVESLQLTPDHKQVDVTVSIDKSAHNIARENSRFWIVKAHVGAAEIRGLMTIVSGDYIQVEPGDGKPQTKFQGLENPPVVAKPGELQIVLLAERIDSLKPHSPVFYRGVEVGEVSRCDLGPSSQTVQIHVDIRKPYAPLVRVNSKFWRTGGIDMNLGLSGAQISAQSFKTLIGGGIDFATPDTDQKQAPPNTSFRLYEKPQNDWLAWAPAIEIDQSAAATQPIHEQTARGGQ